MGQGRVAAHDARLVSFFCAKQTECVHKPTLRHARRTTGGSTAVRHPAARARLATRVGYTDLERAAKSGINTFRQVPVTAGAGAAAPHPPRGEHLHRRRWVPRPNLEQPP